MPAKKIVHKQDVLNAALDLIREKGENALSARDIATMLNCSTQPLYSIFKNMGELDDAVRQAVAGVLDEYMERELKSGKYKANKAIGMGYIRFAAEEKNLYRFLYMRKPHEKSDINVDMTKKSMGFIKERNGIDDAAAAGYFVEIWIFCHGIASMIAAEILEFDEERIAEITSDVAEGLDLRQKSKKKGV